jgi:hypothetical protein
LSLLLLRGPAADAGPLFYRFLSDVFTSMKLPALQGAPGLPLSQLF